MKNLYFFLTLFAVGFITAQTPSNPQGQYLFTGGNLQNDLNPGSNDIVATGNARTLQADRLGEQNNAVVLNGDNYTRSSLVSDTSSEISWSFWLKTSTNDANYRTILEQSNRTAPLFVNDQDPERGHYLYLRNGRVGFYGAYNRYNNSAVKTQVLLDYSHTQNISDDNWHHITINLTRSFIGVVGNNAQLRYDIEIFIDGAVESFTNTSPNNNFFDVLNFQSNCSIGTNPSQNLPATNTYADSFDDFTFFSRNLSQTEVDDLFLDGGFCEAPKSGDLRLLDSGPRFLEVGFNDSSGYQLQYKEIGQSWTLGLSTQTSFQQNINISFLNPSTLYELRIRKLCSNGNFSSYGPSVIYSTKNTSDIIYVDTDANGTNDGSSWANAYSNLRTALNAATSGSIVWVAEGTYTPDVFDTLISFEISADNVSVYGGFSGNEFQLAQRNIVNNPTILSGDLFADDNVNLTFGNTTKSDNSETILEISGANTIVDGFTITGANNLTEGGGIVKIPTANSDSYMRNLTIVDNIAVTKGAGASLSLATLDNFFFVNCVFKNNLSTAYTAINATKTGSGRAQVITLNSLFDGNRVEDTSGTLGLTGPIGGFLALNDARLDAYFYNTTFVNNIDFGTATNIDKGVIITGKSGFLSRADLDLQNSIFFNNLDGNTSSLQKHYGKSNIAEASVIKQAQYCISDRDFGGLINLTQNLENTDPLFTNVANEDYTLSSMSLGIDSGRNSFIRAFASNDLNGDLRLRGTTIDRGAYETSKPCGNISGLDFRVTNDSPYSDGILSWTHTEDPFGPFEIGYRDVNVGGAYTVINNITTQTVYLKNLVSGTFYEFYVNTVCSGTTNTAVTDVFGFNAALLVNENATGRGDGSNWTNAYTSFISALSNVEDGGAIWFAEGLYTTPDVTNSSGFNIVRSNISIFGGFEVTNYDPTLRDTFVNETVLDADDQQNDNGSVDFNNVAPFRVDNAEHVLNISGDNILIDGLTLKGGQAVGPGTGPDIRLGGGVYLATNVMSFTAQNCTFKENVAFGGAAIHYDIPNGGLLTVLGCRFIDNVGNFATIHTRTLDNTTASVNVESCLFENNLTKDTNSSQVGFTGSAIWANAQGQNSDLTTNIINCTITDNQDIGNSGATQRSPISASRVSGSNSTHTLNITNSIIWNNTGAGGTILNAVNQANGQNISSASFESSITNNDFLGFPPSFKNNTSTTDPLFTDAANDDYTLQTSSPAKDVGLSNMTVYPFDASQLPRVGGNGIDYGALEFNNNTLSVNDITNTTLIAPKLYPNPARDVVNLDFNKKISSYEIFNITGQSIQKGYTKKINISSLQQGIYLIKTNWENNTSIVLKLIKK